MKFILISALLFFSYAEISAQESNPDKFSFGYYLEGNYTFLKPTKYSSVEFRQQNSFGIGLGILADYNINPHFWLTTSAGLSFSDAFLDFSYANGTNFKYEILPQNLDFRLHANYTISDNKSKPYFFLGPSLTQAINYKSIETYIFTTNTGFSIDFGFGLEKETINFNFAPEIRYSYGLNNINWSPQLHSLNAHRITLAFNFKD